MLLFDVYCDGEPATNVDLSGAHLLGQDAVPVRAEISATGGRVTCMKRAAGASALALLWDLGDGGRIMLATTRLPERKQPYNLNLELARERMMMLVQKREDWGLFDYPAGQHLTDEADQVRQLFIAAIKANAEDPAAAAKLADRCLSEGVAVSETTATFHAEIFLTRRKKNHDVSRPTFGCTANLPVLSDLFQLRLGEVCNFISLPMPWKSVEPHEGQVQLGQVDAWVQACQRRRLHVHAGPLVSFEPEFFPEWIYIWEHDFETLRDMIYEHVQRLVTRYAAHVRAWNVVSSVNAFSCFNLSFERIMELTRMSCSLVKKLAPGASVVIDLAMPWGEYFASNQRTVPPMMYADMCVQSGVKFDAFGVRLLMGVASDGMYVRDLMQISDKLDEFAGFSKPVHVTACQVPSDVQPDPWDYWKGEMRADLGGAWRAPWDPANQARWLEAFYNLALSKPFVETVCWQDLADYEGHYLPHGGLCGRDLRPKPAFDALKRLRAEMSPSPADRGQGKPASPGNNNRGPAPT